MAQRSEEYQPLPTIVKMDDGKVLKVVDARSDISASREQIPLYKGDEIIGHAQIDPNDYEEISKFRWAFAPSTRSA